MVAMVALASEYSVAYLVGSVTALVLLLVAAIGLALRARRRPPGRALTTDAIAALVCGVLLVGGAVRSYDRYLASHSPWDTQRGRGLRAGFIDGCQPGASGRVDCGCVFEYLTKTPSYDTPDELVTLRVPLGEAERTGDARLLPPELLEALASCRVMQVG
jgi:hypothetical protein